ncbi:MAG: hypothetical protein AAGF73_09885 [Actinomycetota bacterium]
MLARTSILAAAAVLSVGATVHANEQQTDNNTTTGNAANVLVYELDLTSSKIRGEDVESGNGYFQIDDGTAAFNFVTRAAANGAADITEIDARLFNFVPPAPGQSIELRPDYGVVSYLGFPDEGITELRVSNVDGTYEVSTGPGNVAVFRPV